MATYWMENYNKFIEENNLRSIISAEKMPDTTWIDERPWIYIDNIMRVIVPPESVYPLFAEIINYFKKDEFEVLARINIELEKELKTLGNLKISKNIVTGIVNSQKLKNLLIDIAEKDLSNDLINLSLQSTSKEQLFVMNNKGFAFIDGSKLRKKEKIDIVHIILESHDKSRDFQFVKNKLKNKFQLVILHDKAPVLIKKL